MGEVCTMLKRMQKTKDGQEVKHTDQSCCKITCGYCGKRKHYGDECHIKCQEYDKVKKAEEQRRKNARKGKPEGGAENPWKVSVRVTPVGDKCPQPPHWWRTSTQPHISGCSG